MMTTSMKHMRKYAWWTAAASVAVVIGVIAGTYVGRTTNTASHIMNFNTGVPTRFSPQPTFFCNALHQGGGLRQMVDNAGIGSTVSPSEESTNLLMLKFVVAASPNQSTRKLMIGLYQSVLSGDSQSLTESEAITGVEGMNPCARYP
jgi:hypothetical protein